MITRQEGSRVWVVEGRWDIEDYDPELDDPPECHRDGEDPPDLPPEPT